MNKLDNIQKRHSICNARTMRKWLVAIVAAVCVMIEASAQSYGKLQRVYFNLYTDSIKTVLNYYVNVEGQYEHNRILPLDTSLVVITSDKGSMVGNEWIVPQKIDFEKVTFTTFAKENHKLRDMV